ncbi:MAG: isochorismate synthase [Bacteroidetes bacterium]|nr:isochorismate synthase [Bacteroidota bacterium]
MAFDSFAYQSLGRLQQVCLKQNIPFASYRLPLDREIVTVVQHHSMPEKLSRMNEPELKAGFVVAPFTESTGNDSYFLQPDCVFFSNDIDDIYIEKLAANNRFVLEDKAANNVRTTSSEEFVGQVNKAVAVLKDNALQKVVLSRVRVEELPEGFSPDVFFLNLCRKYPYAFVYMMQLPQVGCWIGASPEPLLAVEDGKVKTVSLAGTQVATDLDTEKYRWTSKEIEEQGIVTNYVEKTLQSFDVKDISKTGPENYRAANLIHLKTSFEFRQAGLKNGFFDFLKALHPTPSVGGLPKVEALEFILENEKHDRSFYSGFLGPVNIEGKSAVFVNLRCLRLFEKEFVLYSGAGITTASVAEKEWDETDNKMLTMLNVIRS